MRAGRDELTIEEPRRWPRLLGVLLVVLLSAAAVVLVLRRTPVPPVFVEADSVRSDVTMAADSLEVVVTWKLTRAPAAVRPESLRVEVGLEQGTEVTVNMLPPSQNSDTARISAPAPGETAEGYSCVAALHRGQLSRESCTPWLFVRPAAQAPEVARTDTARRPRVQPLRIVIQPSGLQVDPDVNGRCAAWQRRFPGRSVWIEVNQTAIAECTGPNGRPTVAQFCTFVELANGQRMKTANSANNSYCDRLFQEWAREKTAARRPERQIAS